MQKFHANGKLLLTGEYVVLDGAKALAIPTRFGQALEVEQSDDAEVCNWQSFDVNKKEWFSAKWKVDERSMALIETTEENTAERLIQIFEAANKQSSLAIQSLAGKNFRTFLEFPRAWGLGTSSTLLSLLGQYFEVSPFTLLEHSFGGSGYDIACAQASESLVYLLNNGQPEWETIDWEPLCREQLYFVFLEQKQNSREGIKRYRESGAEKLEAISLMTNLTLDLVWNSDFAAVSRIIKEHESIISKLVNLTPVQEEKFPDFPGAIKSLGAWGGDFVMVLSPWLPGKTKAHFNDKGYSVVLTFDEMILPKNKN